MNAGPVRSPPAVLSRRRVLAGGLLATAALLTPIAAAQGPASRPLRAAPASARLRGRDATPVEVLGYDGATPGPLLRVRRGEDVQVRLANALTEPTAMHWRGVRLASAMDGAPGLTQPPIPPGGNYDVRFSARDAGTFAYHADTSAPGQMDRGLAGVLIVDEAQPIPVDRDVVLAFQDWAPAASEPRAAHLTVNGGPALDIPVRAIERVRLRLANLSRTRLLAVAVEDHAPVVMAIDGQPAEPFEAREGQIVLGPGNRADLFVDTLSPPGTVSAITVATRLARVPLARLVYDNGPPARVATLPAPTPLPANPLPGRIDLSRALYLECPLDPAAPRAAIRILRDGQSSVPNREATMPLWQSTASTAKGMAHAPLFSVTAGRPVMLAFANPAPDAFFAVHLRGHAARLLDGLDDGWKPYWLDTVLALARQTTRIAFVADNPGRWRLDVQRTDSGEDGFSAWFDVS